MKVGVVKEIKSDEYRIALTPAGARELVQRGHEVLVEAGAGGGSSFPDDADERVGARPGAAPPGWGEAGLPPKGKEPPPPEYPPPPEGPPAFPDLHPAPRDDRSPPLG